MADRDVSSPEVQLALVEGARDRMAKQAQFWLSNPKVSAALKRFDPATDIEIREAG